MDKCFVFSYDFLKIFLRFCGAAGNNYTLCRVHKRSLFTQCESQGQVSAVTKEECEQLAQKDWDGQVGTVWKSGSAYCVPNPEFHCHDLC